jgi:quercetin dioxygenase-like cupin family protein
MIKKKASEVPGVAIDKPGFKGMTARFALTKDDNMPHYALRIMEFAPGGHTSLHGHLEEHEFYLIEGEGVLVYGDGQETSLSAGDIFYTAPHEQHQIKNAGTSVLRVVCTIPILAGGDGKSTTHQSGGTY